MPESWLLLRVPRGPEADTMSAVLSVDGAIRTAVGPDIPATIDAVLAGAPPPEGLRLVLPLDGRHGLAHAALDEANRRGWGFSRHLPAGEELHLLDLRGPDANPASVDETFVALQAEAGAALKASELGEAMAVLRQSLAMCAANPGWWHPDTLWALSNLVRVADATGAPENVAEAAGLAAVVLAQPRPETLENAAGTLRKLGELAHNLHDAGQTGLAGRALAASVELARGCYGENHENHLGMLNNYALFLSATGARDAIWVFEDLLARARATLGPDHPRVGVVERNFAEFMRTV